MSPSLTAGWIGIALGASAAVSLAALAARGLTPGGAAAAFVVGAVTFGFGGAPLAVPLVVFFVTSTALGRLGGERGRRAQRITAREGPRDAVQVLANGAVPAALAVVAGVTNQVEPWLMAVGALAAANADTWATELGVLWRGQPWHLGTGRRVPAGTSGAVSGAGLAAALAGAAVVALAAWLALPPYSLRLVAAQHLPQVLAPAWAGFLGAFADSVLGASLQARYVCRECGAATEAPVHCRRSARRVRGVRHMTGDLVNLLATASGALFTYVLLRFAATVTP